MKNIMNLSAWTASFGLLLTVFVMPAFAQGTAFTYQGRLNDDANPANGNYDLRFTVYDSSGGPTVVAGPLTNSPTSVSLASVDPDFNPGANREVLCMAEQVDGKIVVGGYFTMLGGQPRTYIGRLNPDGSLDNSFNPAASGGSAVPHVACLAVQLDGKVLAGGAFVTMGGQSRTNLARLNSDGTLDTAFNPGASYLVACLAAQPDGKILVGGAFSTLGGQARHGIGRLKADGTIDPDFTTGVGPASKRYVFSLAVQADGKILVGGSFTTVAGQPRNYLARLNADGTLDATFNPGADSSVYSLAVQADGRILVAGQFRTLGGQPRYRIGRLNADGTLDATFNPGASGIVYGLALQADGRILVAGSFSTLGGQPASCIGRLHPDGTVDSSFILGVRGGSTFSEVNSLAVQASGMILVGGNFATLAGQPRDNLGRLHNTELATQQFSVDGSSTVWLRGGTSPEVWRTTFEASTNHGAGWFSLGDGTRISGGWQLNGLTPGAGATIRARGFTTGGRYNGSSWFVESFFTVPTIPELVQHLIQQVTESDVRQKQPLLASLAAALASIERGNCHAALGQLHAFQNKVRAQVADTELATEWIAAAGQIIAALDCGGQPGVAARVHSPKCIANGRLQMQIEGAAAQVCNVEASTNLLDWEIVGTVTLPASGALEYEDAEAGAHARRFYRLVPQP